MRGLYYLSNYICTIELQHLFTRLLTDARYVSETGRYHYEGTGRREGLANMLMAWTNLEQASTKVQLAKSIPTRVPCLQFGAITTSLLDFHHP